MTASSGGYSGPRTHSRKRPFLVDEDEDEEEENKSSCPRLAHKKARRLPQRHTSEHGASVGESLHPLRNHHHPR
ncbi:hypothetical protein CJ030_MR6G029205 [Morella rubra]|uniref:Uncharacterized protein n=1 Tax=Morella rubra TaxID=262757 RepID=A0A6A1V9V5_9ROSI|nr:hypothetical protein CJ030_MR6G029205 [Morella rubra]